jgi:hypothetical protein
LVREDLSADAERFQCPSGCGFAQGVQAEHQVFGPDVVIVARPRFGLGSLQQSNCQRRELRWASPKEGFGHSNVLTFRCAPWQVRHCFSPTELTRRTFTAQLAERLRSKDLRHSQIIARNRRDKHQRHQGRQ